MTTTPSPSRAHPQQAAPVKAAPAAALDDLELAALISSKICHDLISPVGAIANGLEVIADDDEQQSRDFAMEVIHNSTVAASAKLQFFRFAFGSAGSVGAVVDLAMAEQIARAYVGRGKHKLSWQSPPGQMPKDKLKLFLNLIASALTALPRGGEIIAAVRGRIDDPAFEVRCIGAGARPPAYLRDFIATPEGLKVEALSVQAYYTVRLARLAGLRLGAGMEGVDAVLAAVR